MKTISELAALGPEEWRDWLRDGIRAWHSVAIEPDEVMPGDPRAKVRREAFHPFNVSPREPAPVDALAAQFRGAFSGHVPSAAGRGMELLLQGWQVANDGAEATAFVIALAVRLDAANLGSLLRELTLRPMGTNTKDRACVIEAIIYGLKQRGSSKDRLQVARILAGKGWLSPQVAARLLPALAEGDARDLAVLIAELSPQLATDGVKSPAVRELEAGIRAIEQWRFNSGGDERAGPAFAAAMTRIWDLCDPAARVTQILFVQRTASRSRAEARAVIESMKAVRSLKRHRNYNEKRGRSGKRDFAT